ncbi:MAG: hypothetical protein WCB04_05270 [Mycobacteriales bacterium]
MSEQSTRHAPPFYCPYCGEEDIVPHGEAAGEWHCGACLRAFVLRLVGTGVTR